MNIDLLIEKYIGRLLGMGGSYKKMSCEIFKNPSASEMKSASPDKKLRFIADSVKKNLYVWRYDGSYHGDVWDEYMNRSDYGIMSFKTLWGIIKLSKGKWIMTRSDSQEDYIDNEGDIQSIVNRFKWLDNYNVDVKTWLSNPDWRQINDRWE
jgi:hypothetical protein